MAVPSTTLAVLVRCLILLGVGAQLWTFHGLRYDPPIFVGGSIGDSLAGITAYLSPMLLAVGGAVLARLLHRRAPGWALLAAGASCAVLLLGVGLAVYLTLSPVRRRRFGRLGPSFGCRKRRGFGVFDAAVCGAGSSTVEGEGSEARFGRPPPVSANCTETSTSCGGSTAGRDARPTSRISIAATPWSRSEPKSVADARRGSTAGSATEIPGRR